MSGTRYGPVRSWCERPYISLTPSSSVPGKIGSALTLSGWVVLFPVREIQSPAKVLGDPISQKHRDPYSSINLNKK